MTTPLRHDVYPCSFDSLTVNDVRSVSETPGVSLMHMIAGGNVQASSIAMNYAEPMIAVTTGDIATVLGAVSLSTGLAISSAFEVQYQKRAAGGVFSVGSSHVTANGTAGYLYVTGVSAEQDAAEGAEVQLQFMALSSNGYSAPITINTSQGLTGTPAIVARYALGPVYCDGDLIAGVQSVKVDSGLTVKATRSDGGVFATTCHVTERKPTVEIQVLNPALADEANQGYFIQALSGSGVVVYLQKVSAGGGRVAGATGEHISFTSATGVWTITGQSATARGDVVTTIKGDLTAAFTVSTTATLP